MKRTRPDINESLYYDKYYVIKKTGATTLAQEAIRQLTEETASREGGGTIEVDDILGRMCSLHGKQYFCLNLDEEASLKAMQTYYHSKYDKNAAEQCIEYIMKREVGKEVVFKGKCLTRGRVVDVWHHPDGGKVFDVRDKENGLHSVPEGWVVKWIEAPAEVEGEKGNGAK
ncbi:hypothetical protein CVU37_05715 [candidate division BRC1 bacterium HGW-BRC1-1]|jgi:hypothetical protein|nr:MAG: hypothetical protein CVU37_05715 [candidate division BRC1 bacterium HGW-BRC1-1]